MLDGHRSLELDDVPAGEILRDVNDWSLHDRIEFFVLVLLRRIRLVEIYIGNPEISVHVSHVFDFLVEEMFDYFKRHTSDHEGRGGRDGGNDFPCRDLHVEFLHFFDVVVLRSQIGQRRQELDVPVLRIVLLKVALLERALLLDVDLLDFLNGLLQVLER